MKFSTHVLSFIGACLLAGHASAITVEDDAVLYCVGATTGNRGVYTLPLEGPYPDSPTKISTTALGGIQWSFMNSGGTFLSKEKAVGTAVMYGTSVYVSIATAEGNGDGPWTHSYYQYSNSYPDTMKATDMVYDPTEDKVYTWCFQSTYYTALGTFDADNKSATMIGAAGFTKINALAIDAEGTLWGINGAQGTIYTIDKATGALTQKFSLGQSYSGDNQSAAYDPASGKIYWGATSTYAAALFAIDLEAQTCEKVYDFPMGARFNGFYIPGPDTKKGAPAAPENLTAVYSGEGNKMNVSFTAP
ncbi:MAG: hypothetical protein K2O10_03880, partial [Muribaculaceae bacterium]|nr:hypothetical protein [Muribaculaceae bacterium]